MISPNVDCEHCNGSGFHNGSTCLCVRIKELQVRVQQGFAKHGRLFERVEIPKRAVALTSPLASEARARSENMIVRADWPHFMHHLACCVVLETLRDLRVFANEWPLQVTTDLAIRMAYFADGACKHTELVNSQSLVVIRLGSASIHATNAPALYEVLATADDQSIPVWLVETPAKPFKAKHPSWSEDIQEVVKGWPKTNLVAQVNDPETVNLEILGEDA
jgi:hypothetical protein